MAQPVSLARLLGPPEAGIGPPPLAEAEAIIGLGDLAHFGDRDWLMAVIEVVEQRGLPTVLLSGNHDVEEDGVRLEKLVVDSGARYIVTPLGPAPELTLATLAARRERGLS